MPILKLLSSSHRGIQLSHPALQIFRPSSRSLLGGKSFALLRSPSTAQRAQQFIQELITLAGRIRTAAEENNSKKPNGDKPPCEPSAGAGSNPPPAPPTPAQMPVPNNHGVGTDREIGHTQWMKLAIVLMGPVIAIVSICSAIFLAMNGESATANIIAIVGILGGIAWGACFTWIFLGQRKQKSSKA